jgi:predicted amidohydrolase YtcJ
MQFGNTPGSFVFGLAAVTLGTIFLSGGIAEAETPAADLVLRNGSILVFDTIEQQKTGTASTDADARATDAGRSSAPASPQFAQALAVTDGLIAFTGSNREAEGYVGAATRVIDLGGRMVMPGIVDGHFHGTRPTDCEMGYAGGTVPQILAKLQACLDQPAQAALKNTNIRFDASHLFGEAIEPAGTALTRADLDRLVTTRPIVIEHADGHKFWANSKAIDNAGVDENTPDPPEGAIARDAAGKPTGVFSDFDLGDWGEVAPVTEAMQLETVRRTAADANRMGLTSIFVADKGEEEVAAWARLQDEDALTVRVSLALSAGFARGQSDVDELRKRIAALEPFRRYAKGLIDVRAVKIYCDGVME